MTSTEKDRLDLRSALERVLESERLADIAMDAMPPIDYNQLTTKADLHALGSELQGEMAELRGELRGGNGRAVGRNQGCFGLES